MWQEMMKLKHRRASQAIFARNTAPMLEFGTCHSIAGTFNPFPVPCNPSESG